MSGRPTREQAWASLCKVAAQISVAVAERSERATCTTTRCSPASGSGSSSPGPPAQWVDAGQLAPEQSYERVNGATLILADLLGLPTPV
jgi:hypothetical protein